MRGTDAMVQSPDGIQATADSTPHQLNANTGVSPRTARTAMNMSPVIKTQKLLYAWKTVVSTQQGIAAMASLHPSSTEVACGSFEDEDEVDECFFLAHVRRVLVCLFLWFLS